MENNENKRSRLSIALGSLGWKQRGGASENQKNQQDGVYDNTVQNDSLLFRNKNDARKAEDKAHADAMGKEPSQGIRLAKRERLDVERQVRDGLSNRNNLLRQEKRLGIEGALSFDDLKKAERSTTMVGRKSPLKVKKSVAKEIGKTARKRKNREKLLPSERKRRLSRTKMEKNRSKYREKISTKELTITGPDGRKIKVDQLRKLRGLKTKDQTQKRETSRNSMKKENVKNAGLRIRRRDENVR